MFEGLYLFGHAIVSFLNPLSLALTGNATPTSANRIGVSSSALDFGAVVVGQFAERTLTVTPKAEVIGELETEDCE